MKPVSDGAAFNHLLCLSQLRYIMASNTWSNTLNRKMLCGPQEKGSQSTDRGVNSRVIKKACCLLVIVTDCQSMCRDLVMLSWLYQGDAQATSDVRGISQIGFTFLCVCFNEYNRCWRTCGPYCPLHHHPPEEHHSNSREK